MGFKTGAEGLVPPVSPPTSGELKSKFLRNAMRAVRSRKVEQMILSNFKTCFIALQELKGERLHFELVGGTGPNAGWVSLKVKARTGQSDCRTSVYRAKR